MEPVLVIFIMFFWLITFLFQGYIQSSSAELKSSTSKSSIILNNENPVIGSEITSSSDVCVCETDLIAMVAASKRRYRKKLMLKRRLKKKKSTSFLIVRLLKVRPLFGDQKFTLSENCKVVRYGLMIIFHLIVLNNFRPVPL